MLVWVCLGVKLIGGQGGMLLSDMYVNYLQSYIVLTAMFCLTLFGN